jgi:hypothetical protein
MDLCGLDEAFGLISQPSPSCAGTSAVAESRKHDRKKAKKCRGPQQTYLESDTSFLGASTTDPDRPSAKRLDPVPVVNQEPFIGESGGGDLATIMKVVQGNNLLQKGDKPSYFGASPNESPGSALPGKKTEGFQDSAAPYVVGSGNNDAILNHDFTNDTKAWLEAKKNNGLKNTGVSRYGVLSPELDGLETPDLPPPETSFDWQKAGLRGYEKGKARPKVDTGNDAASRHEILRKMDTILGRLDDMQYINQENAQKEVLLFIMTGLGVLFVMDIACRASIRL